MIIILSMSITTVPKNRAEYVELFSPIPNAEPTNVVGADRDKPLSLRPYPSLQQLPEPAQD
jgi:hypothetical protein